MDKIISVKDANGRWVSLTPAHITDMLVREGRKILGITLENIGDLKTQYELRNGKYPMTTESIEEAFRMSEERSQFG